MRKFPSFNGTFICKRCGAEIPKTGPRQFYCPECQKTVIEETKRRWYIKTNPRAYAEKPQRFCVACGEKAVSSRNGKWYCNKHWLRMYLHGTLESQYRSKNTYTINDGVVEMRTTRGEVFYFDECDLENAIKHTWCVSRTNYLVSNINHKVTKFHRYILSVPPQYVTDHINGNTFDNRRCNLRICDMYSNGKNLKLKTNNTSGYPGVRIIQQKTYTAYVARITVGDKEIRIGTFDTYQKALDARKQAELKYYGEFAPGLGVLTNHFS